MVRRDRRKRFYPPLRGGCATYTTARSQPAESNCARRFTKPLAHLEPRKACGPALAVTRRIRSRTVLGPEPTLRVELRLAAYEAATTPSGGRHCRASGSRTLLLLYIRQRHHRTAHALSHGWDSNPEHSVLETDASTNWATMRSGRRDSNPQSSGF